MKKRYARVILSLEGDYRIHFLAAWKKNNVNPASQLFIEMLGEMGVQA